MDPKVFELILFELDDKTIKSLRVTGFDFREGIEYIEKDNRYWFEKLNKLLGFKLSKVPRNSREKYEKLSKLDKITPQEVIRLDYADILEGFIENGWNPAENDNYAIRFASRFGHSKVVKLLLKDPRVDPRVSNNLAIRLASEDGHAGVIKLLLEDPRVDPSADDNEAILLASVNGHSKAMKLLLKDKRVRKNLSEEEIEMYEKDAAMIF